MIAKPYLLFVGDTDHESWAKTALGVRDWCRSDCIGQWRLPGATIDLGLPEMRPAAAVAAGARSMIVGVSQIGGALPAAWVPSLVEALATGLDLVAGLHTRLSAEPRLRDVAAEHGRAMHDVRFYDGPLRVGTGRRRPGKRVLTVGTDCSLGKKYTALTIAREMRARGIAATFRATGQTGIMIAGAGIAVDAVVADFLAGVAEMLSPAADPDHWDVIEGQGAILHPAYAGVTLGLLHGSQPDAMILCHDPTRTHTNGFPEHRIAPLPSTILLYEQLARATNPLARVVAVSLNTAKVEESLARAATVAVTDQTGLPAGDPVRWGAGEMVDAMLAHTSAAS